MAYWEYPSIKKHSIVLFSVMILLGCIGIIFFSRYTQNLVTTTVESQAVQIANFMNRKICDEDLCRLIPLPAHVHYNHKWRKRPQYQNLISLLDRSQKSFSLQSITLFNDFGQSVLMVQPKKNLVLSSISLVPFSNKPFYSEIRTISNDGFVLDTFVPIQHPHKHQGEMETIGFFKITQNMSQSAIAIAGLKRNGLLLAVSAFIGIFLIAYGVLDRVQKAIASKEKALLLKLDQIHKDYETLKKQEQNEDLSSLGTIVSGIAHELNNPLMTILGYAQLIPENQTLSQKGLNIIQESALRCKKIIENLLIFSRQQQHERSLLSPVDILKQSLARCEDELNAHNITVVLNLPSEDKPSPIWGDAAKIQQVMINLLINAVQAMEKQPSGEIHCSAWMNHNIFYLEIADTGPGIEEQTLKRIFDPFFTTKDVGQGTGLGLSVCYGIIQSHDGQIYARNREEGGASFVVELPLANQQQPSPSLAPNTDQSVSKPYTLGPVSKPDPLGSVLLIDDEKEILSLCQMVLEGKGFSVSISENSQKAIQMLNQNHFDIILCDLKMPGMSGQDFYHLIELSNPNLLPRLIFMTGDTLSGSSVSFLQSTGIRYLKKPFEMEELIEAVVEKMSMISVALPHPCTYSTDCELPPFSE